MGERLTTWIPVTLIGILAAFTFWLDRAVQLTGRDPTGASRHDPDYIVDNLSAVRIGEAGKARYTLSAVKMVHYPDDDTTLLTKPRFVSYSSASAPVTITASQGVVSGKGEHVYFQDDVRVTRAAHGEQSELVVRTTFLHLIPDDNIARTDRPVTLTDDATAVTAVGLELNNDTRVLKLFSNIRGTYEPRKAPRREGKR